MNDDRLPAWVMHKCILNGQLPTTFFNLEAVDHYRLDGGYWHPYQSDGQLMPGPSFRVTAVDMNYTIPAAVSQIKLDMTISREGVDVK